MANANEWLPGEKAEQYYWQARWKLSCWEGTLYTLEILGHEVSCLIPFV